MAEVSLLQLFLTTDFWVLLAIRSVVAGLILYLTSRLVGAKGGLLSAMGVAFLNVVIVIFLFESYIFPLLAFESTDLVTALQTNILGFILALLLPGIIWFVLVMVLLKVGPMQALIIAFVQWLLGVALTYFGVLTFLTAFL